MNPQQMMAALFSGQDQGDKVYDITNAIADGEKLKKLADVYDVPLDYDVGDLIEWKPGLKDTRNKLPDYGQPVICRQIKQRTMPESCNTGRTAVSYADVHFGALVDGGYIEFIDDQSRFRKYRPPQDNLPQKKEASTNDEAGKGSV